MKYLICITVIVFVSSLTSCISSKKEVSRSTSSYEGNYEVVNGLNRKQEDELWHISEGADVYPYAWAVNLTNLMDEDRSRYLDNMDIKYNMIPDFGSKYLLKYIGLTTAWSGVRDLSANAFDHNEALHYKTVMVKDKNGQKKPEKSIAMMGTNCALCHSSNLKFNGKYRFLEGGAAIFDPRGFFQDMAGSTVKTMTDETELARFLVKFTDSKGNKKYTTQEAIQAACDFVDSFKTELNVKMLGVVKKFRQENPDQCQSRVILPVSDQHGTVSEVVSAALEVVNTSKEEQARIDAAEKEKNSKWNVRFKNWLLGKAGLTYEDGIKKVKATLLKDDRKVLRKYLAKLLGMTVLRDKDQNVAPEDLSNELKARMDWFSKLATKFPITKETNAGYGRTDAFGRIGNTVARFNDPVPLTANVSIPSMWGTKYRDVFHYNANTNSVLMRNIGQSFGLGAVLINYAFDNNDFTASTNIPGLIRLENLMYQIKVPRWTEVMSDSKVDHAKILPGCNLYLQKCASCHETDLRVGPDNNSDKKLIHYKFFPMNREGIRTDPNQAVLQAKLIDGRPLKDVLFGFTQEVRNQYVKDHPGVDTNRNGLIDIMEETYKMRGTEEFRDPYLGHKKKNKENTYMTLQSNQVSGKSDQLNGIGGGYAARHLSGVWATPPYLHNGSVVSMMDLLSAPSERKKVFYVGDLILDDRNLGIDQELITKNMSIDEYCKKEPNKCFFVEDASHVKKFYEKLDRYLNSEKKKIKDFPTHEHITGNGDSNLGHYIESWGEMTEEQKLSLIEFLKVLKPQPEYSWESDDGLYKITRDYNVAQCVPGPNLNK